MEALKKHSYRISNMTDCELRPHHKFKEGLKLQPEKGKVLLLYF